MNNEKILYYLGILENGALNYYQTVVTIRIASQSIQDYIEHLEQQCKKQKEVKDKFMKNGVFSLEYDKETLRDMVLELQEVSQKQKEVIDKINLIIKGLAYGGSEDYYMENFSKINELLNEVSE